MLRRMLVADVGTTFTKASLVELRKGVWQLVEQTSAPSTAEMSSADVMDGLRNAISKLQALTKLQLLSKNQLVSPSNEQTGVDQFVVTSSAGGGLKILVAGLTEKITAESGYRAALGAGAVVSQVVTLNETGTELRNLDRIKNAQYDLILLTGGTDGGNISDVLAIAEFVSLAAPKNRSGKTSKIPLIYAGNIHARPYVEKIIGDAMEITWVENIRPTVETEVLEPVRHVIHDFFLEHTKSSVPGFDALASLAANNVVPTPIAIGKALSTMALSKNSDILGVDVGGATTDVFSVIDGKLYRSVLANVGMSHGISNMLQETTLESICKLLPCETDENFIRNWYLNKALRPTTLPQTMKDLMIEQAFAKEAIRLSLNHHRSLVAGLKGIKIKREIGDVFTQHGTGRTLVNLLKTDAIIGLGGVIANSPKVNHAVSLILDGVLPEGVTDIYLDRGLFLPYTCIVGRAKQDLHEIPENDLGFEALDLAATCIGPVGPPVRIGTPVAIARLGAGVHEILAGSLTIVNFENGSHIDAEIIPRKDFDIGAGPGNPLSTKISKSRMGVILDGRGRPLAFPTHKGLQNGTAKQWYTSLDVCP